jgi:hypothetical protein
MMYEMKRERESMCGRSDLDECVGRRRQWKMAVEFEGRSYSEHATTIRGRRY